MNVVSKMSVSYNDNPYIKSLLQLVPGWGSADTLLQKRAEEIKTERMNTFFNELAKGQHELTDELIKSEDFLHCFFSTMKAALNTRHREKIRMLARLLNSSVSPSINSNTDEYEELLAVLEAISLREFNALYILFQFEQSSPQQEKENTLQSIMKYWEEFKSNVIRDLKMPENSLAAFMAKIERTGLYLRLTGGFYDYKGDLGQTTPLFKRLLEFIETKS